MVKVGTTKAPSKTIVKVKRSTAETGDGTVPAQQFGCIIPKLTDFIVINSTLISCNSRLFQTTSDCAHWDRYAVKVLPSINDISTEWLALKDK